MGPGPGRRERKKAATRHSIAEAALRLFLEHGYDRVGIREVAAEADVAVTTVFAHFSSKEALVFEHDEDFERSLAEVVTDQTSSEPLVASLRRGIGLLVRHSTDDSVVPVWRLIDATPALRTYEASMRARHAESLAATIAATLGLSSSATACRTIAWFAIDAYALSRTSQEPDAVLDEAFRMIDAAWTATGLVDRREVVIHP